MSGSRNAHWYKIFGLFVRSEIELPEASVVLATPPQTSDFVDVCLGATPLALENGALLTPWMEVGGDECLYHFEGVCRIHAVAGRSIVLEPFPDVPERDVRAFLFGSGFAAIVHQRRLMPLHISAVLSPIGVIAFTGPSGAGKSTLAATAAKYNDWPVVCDDLAVIDPADDTLKLNVGTKRKKLWRDAITALDLTARRMDRDVSRLEKFHLQIDDDVGDVAPAISHLYELAWGETCSIRELPPAGRFALVMNAIYRPYLTPIFGDVAVVRRVAFSMASKMRAFVLERPQRLDELEAVARALADHCERVP